MSKNNRETWNTKYGARRVRKEEPVLAEAIAAAQGLSDDIDEQTDIANDGLTRLDVSPMFMPRWSDHAVVLQPHH